MWKHGEKARLAERAGLSRGFVTNLIRRRVRCSPDMAVKLEKICQEMRIPISKEDWVFTAETDNQWFEPKEML